MIKRLAPALAAAVLAATPAAAQLSRAEQTMIQSIDAEQADTTHHGRPTPLLDELLGTASTERQGMGQRSSR